MADDPNKNEGQDDLLPELSPVDEGAAPDETVAGGGDPEATAVPGTGGPEETITTGETIAIETGGDSSAFETVIEGDAPAPEGPPPDVDTFIEESAGGPPADIPAAVPVDAPAGGETTGSTQVTGEIIEELPPPPGARPAAAAVAAPPSELVPLERKKPKSDVWTLFLVFTFVIFGTGIYVTAKELYDIYDLRFGILSQEVENTEEEEEGEAPKADEKKKEADQKAGDEKKDGEQKPDAGQGEKKEEKKEEPKAPAGGGAGNGGNDGGYPADPNK